MSVDPPEIVDELVPAPTSRLLISRFGRKRYSTASRYVDFIPDQLPTFLRAPSLPPIDPPSFADNADMDIPPSPAPTSELRAHPEMITPADSFGLQRQYYEVPSSNPDENTTLTTICDSPDLLVPRSNARSRWWRGLGSAADPDLSIQATVTPTDANGAPFLNPTALLLMNWFYNSSRKTLSDLNSLVRDVILHTDWRRQDLHDFEAHRAQKQYDKLIGASSHSTDDAPPHDNKPLPFTAADGWRQGSVRIRLPKEKRSFEGGEKNAPAMTLDGLWYRKLTEVIKSVLQDPSSSERHHLTPFRLFWSTNSAVDDHQPPSPSPSSSYPNTTADVPNTDSSSQPHSGATGNTSPSPGTTLPDDAERIYHEVYTSEAMNREHEKLREKFGSTPHPETVIAALILYSDSTHLANFGSASLWPIYLFLGNLSKYERGKPSAFAAHHLAYIPSASLLLLF